MRGYGLNAVRLPFGYWVITEPRAREPYIGPALEYVDRAVAWAEERFEEEEEEEEEDGFQWI